MATKKKPTKKKKLKKQSDDPEERALERIVDALLKVPPKKKGKN